SPDQSTLGLGITEAIGVCGVIDGVDVIAQSRHSDPTVVVEKIDTGPGLIGVIGTHPGSRFAKLAYPPTWFSDDIDGFLLLSIIKSTQCSFVTFLIKNLYTGYHVSR